MPRGGLERTGLAILASAAISTLAFFTAPTLFDGVDFVRLHRLNREYAARRVADGQLPLWNPYVGLGRPFLADVETGFFYPPNAAYLLLDPVTGLALLVVLHGALGCLGMRSFCRRLGASSGAAWAGGMVWLGSAPFVERLLAGQSPYAWGIAYLPLAFRAAQRAQDAPSSRSLAHLALVLCLQLLAGHPQIAWITWFGLAWFMAGRTTQPTVLAFGTAVVRSLALLGLAIAWAFALGAVQLLPFAELVSQGNRSHGTLEFAASGAMRAAGWASLVLVPASSEQYQLYAGLVALIAGLCGLTAIASPDRRGLLLMAAAGAALAAGESTPVFRGLYWLVPGISSFRIPSRAGVLLCFALVTSAALHVSAGKEARRLRLLPLAAALALAATVVGHGAGLGVYARPMSWSLALMVASSGALVWWLQASPPRRRAAGAFLALVTALDLGSAIHAHKASIVRPDDLRAEPTVARALAQAGLFEKSGVPPRISVPYWIIRDNAGMLYGYSTFTGYVALTLDRVWTYVHDVLAIARPDVENTYPSKDIYALGPFPYSTMNLSLGLDPAGTLVVRNDPDPRAYVVGRARQVRDWAEALRVIVAGHDSHREALVEEAFVSGMPAFAPRAPGGEVPSSTARISRFAPEAVMVEVESSGPGLLVLAEAWYPGWRATVNGRVASCMPANVWMRAVPVPAGRSQVRIWFRSTYLAAGAVISVLSLLALAAALGWRGGASGLGPTPRVARAAST